MSIQQWEHWEKLAKKHELETKVVKKQLYHAGRIIEEKNKKIEELQEMISFYGDQLRTLKANYQEQVHLNDIIRKRQKMENN